MDVFNLFNGATETPADPNDPPGYACSAVRVGPKIGAAKVGMSVYELPAGQAVCPYHFEWTDEEWLIVIAGRPTLRSADGERRLEPGDVVCFPRRTTWALRNTRTATRSASGQTGRTTCCGGPITSTTGTASAEMRICLGSLPSVLPN